MTSNARALHLHVGMHKTGSTAIQRTLEGYRSDQVHYAAFGESNHSIAAKTVFCKGRHGYHYHRNRGLSATKIDELADKWRSQLRRSIAECPGNLIISGEDICTISREDLFDLRDFFVNDFEQVRVLAYVREPVSFCSSYFQQVVRGGLVDFTVPVPAYRSRFEKILDVFGAKQVTFVRFARDEFVQGCVIEDFARRTGVDLSETPKIVTNESLPLEAVALAYQHNRSGLIQPGNAALVAARSRALQKLAELFDTPFLLAEDVVRAALDSGDIDWMEDTAGFALRPTTKTEGQEAVRDESHLLGAAQAAEPKLMRWLQQRGLDHHSDNPMHALVMAYLAESEGTS